MDRNASASECYDQDSMSSNLDEHTRGADTLDSYDITPCIGFSQSRIDILESQIEFLESKISLSSVSTVTKRPRAFL